MAKIFSFFLWFYTSENRQRQLGFFVLFYPAGPFPSSSSTLSHRIASDFLSFSSSSPSSHGHSPPEVRLGLQEGGVGLSPRRASQPSPTEARLGLRWREAAAAAGWARCGRCWPSCSGGDSTSPSSSPTSGSSRYPFLPISPPRVSSSLAVPIARSDLVIHTCVLDWFFLVLNLVVAW
jgi:hypothetical protein